MKDWAMKTIFALFGVILSFSLCAQIVREVPAEYQTIQKAIDAAQEGDTVLVSPGVYFENLQLRGRNIVLTSRFRLDNNPDLIEQTVIDGSQPVHPDTASCLLIWKNEGPTTVVEGFTFQGGSGTVWLDPAGAGTFREGGGILTEYASPVIRHNIIRNNNVAPAGPGMVSSGGGGIRSGEGAPLIENNLITNNFAEGYGGGIVLNYCPDAVVRNNIITHNAGGKEYAGGGFWATGAGQSTVVQLHNNVIAYNQAIGPVGAYGGKGGGIWVFSIKVQGYGNIVWGNTQLSGKQVAHLNAAMQIRYSCVQDGWNGVGNFSDDPLFADTVCFLLSPGSPCIDKGQPDALANDFSINGERAAYPSRGALRNDAGAYGGAARGPLHCSNWLKSPSTFTAVLNSPVSTTPGDSRSVNWIDIDGDHDLDLFISNGPQIGANNFLYRNNGQGQFTAVSGDPIVSDGKPSDGATWADYDNDGDNDCFVVNWFGVNNLMYRNNGDGSFTQITTGGPVTDGGYSETASWGDYDSDGWLDLYVTNSDGVPKNFLYHNNGDGTFTKITAGPQVNDAYISRCVNWTDYDNDGDADLFVSNENNQAENLYRNNADGSFTKITAGALLNDGGKTMSASWGDYDNDGWLDVFLANDQANDALFHNDGSGNFTKITTGPVVGSGGNTFGSQWADVDNDGDLDLFATNSFWGGPWHNFLYRNNGDGSFSRDTTEIVTRDEGWSYGCAFGDFDRDGDLDLAVANCQNASQPDYLYENHAAESLNNWLVVECVGTLSNRSAIGARVRVKSMSGGQMTEQLREISAQSGYCGQNQLAPHFGLGPDAVIESITVEWPSGLEEVFGNILPNQYITLVEGGGTGTGAEPTAGLRIWPPAPNPFHDSVTCRFTLAEARRIDIQVIDIQGKTIKHLFSGQIQAGEQRVVWDGTTSDGSPAPAGQYLIVFRQDEKVIARHCVKF